MSLLNLAFDDSKSKSLFGTATGAGVGAGGPRRCVLLRVAAAAAAAACGMGGSDADAGGRLLGLETESLAISSSTLSEDASGALEGAKVELGPSLASLSFGLDAAAVGAGAGV